MHRGTRNTKKVLKKQPNICIVSSRWILKENKCVNYPPKYDEGHKLAKQHSIPTTAWKQRQITDVLFTSSKCFMKLLYVTDVANYQKY